MMKHKIPVEWMQRYESEAFARWMTASSSEMVRLPMTCSWLVKHEKECKR